MIDEPPVEARPAFGLLQFAGADARKFLQGQLSNDMALLGGEKIILAGYHNPQGRVLALLRLLSPVPDEVIALLPAELAGPTVSALQKFVLRAKVAISLETSATAISAMALQWPALAPLLAPSAHTLNIAAGIPQVYGATSGMFVAQMLNLDCVDAISFSKGCYTGQEIIARAHYRGRIKRRMQRFVTEEAASLTPGAAVTLSDGRAAQIVDAVRRADGRSEFLAVATFPPPSAPAGSAPPAPAPGPAAALSCRALPLPYPLPD